MSMVIGSRKLNIHRLGTTNVSDGPSTDYVIIV